MNSRRKFLVDCSTAVAALALTPISSSGISALAEGSVQSLEHLSYAALAREVHTPFRVRLAPGRTVKLTLLKAPLARPTPATRGGPPPGDAGNEKFSLIFSGPKDALLASAIHKFEHGQLGRFEMYIGQIGTEDTECVRYEAGFNRPVPRASTIFVPGIDT